MFRAFQILSILFVLLFCSISIAQDAGVQSKKASTPAAQIQKAATRSETKGEFRSITGPVKVTKGIPKREFSDLDTAFAALEEKGYSDDGLKQLKTILSNPSADGEDVTNETPGPLDALVVIETTKEGLTKFKISSKDLSGFVSFDQALAAPATQSLCHKSGKCRVCDRKIFCIVKKLLSSRIDDAGRP